MFLVKNFFLPIQKHVQRLLKLKVAKISSDTKVKVRIFKCQGLVHRSIVCKDIKWTRY